MSNNGHGRHVFEFDVYRLYPEERLLSRKKERVNTTPRILDLLIILVKSEGGVVTKSDLLAAMWADSFVEEGNVSRAVSALRKELGTQESGGAFIETVPKIGYRFIAPVREILADLPGDAEVGRAGMPVKWVAALVGSILILAACGYLFLIPALTKTVPTGGLTNVTNSLADDDLPAWSPDGSKIAFTSNRDGPGDVYVMDPDGGNVVRLTNTTAREGAATWSPDGKRIAFDSERDGKAEIYIMNADGSDQTRLTFNPTTDAAPVSFSPDGTRLAFARNASNEGLGAYNFDIYTMNVDGSDVTQATTDPHYDAEPVWSTDGKRIAFITDREENNFEIYSIRPDGEGERNISNSPGNDGVIAFTTDGLRIFCRSDRVESQLKNQIYVIDLDGSNRRQLTYFAANVYRVSYSSRTNKFAFTSKRDGNFEIYSMDVPSF